MQTICCPPVTRASVLVTDSSTQRLPGKQTSVKMVLTHMPDPVFVQVQHHVSMVGWDGSCFTDDSLSNNKIVPGYVFKQSKPGWSDIMGTQGQRDLDVLIVIGLGTETLTF